MSVYRVTFANEALGHFDRLIEARSAADAMLGIVRIAMNSLMSSPEWDAPLVNYGFTVTVKPEIGGLPT